MRFSNYPQVKDRLCEARFTALEKIVEKANTVECELLVIAGDLFNSNKVPKKEVLRSLEILEGFMGNCILYLPGNHDYYSGFPSGIWEVLEAKAYDKLLICKEKKMYSLKEYYLPLFVYPGPCDSQQGTENVISWIKAPEENTAERNDYFHLGLAHGSIEGISPDMTKRYFPMDRGNLEKQNLDLWIIGHTHVSHPRETSKKDSIIVPGTPEPDGFDYPYEGSAWIISVDKKKNMTKERFSTGSYRFIRLEEEIHTGDDLEDTLTGLKKREKERSSGVETLLRLELRGTLPKQDFYRLGPFVEEVQDLLFYAEVDTAGIRPKITPEEIGNEFREGSFAYMLLSRLADNNDPEALQRAYRLIEDMQK